ncbi:MAG: hypothetical protein AAB664_01140 [Patescibacteria group bacterium]
MSFFFLCFLLFVSDPVHEKTDFNISVVVTDLDLPRPFLKKQAYMQLVYSQAILHGANERDLVRLYQIAYTETRENPRLCVPGGCGPFQQEVFRLVPKSMRKFAFAHAVVRFFLTNKPGFSARIALDLLHRCERLSGEHWRCCYGGAYRQLCRIKWDKTYQLKMTDADT